MAEEKSRVMWEGKSTAEIHLFTAAEVWPLVADEFCSLHKWLPDVIDLCHWVEGEPGRPGLTRRCSNSSTNAWAVEKIIAIDPRDTWLIYEVTENSVGLKSYVATIRLLQSVEGGCEIEWSFVAEPVEGWKFEDLTAYIDSCTCAMAQNMETALKSQQSAQ